MYDPKNAKEKQGIPADTVVEGTITAINVGMVKDFVKANDKWKGDVENNAIEVIVSVTHNEETISIAQVFTYTIENGITTYSSKSNLKKFLLKYGQLPEVGMKVKCMSNKDGFLKIRIE